MAKDYVSLADKTIQRLQKLNQGNSAAITCFSNLGIESLKEGALDRKTKTLIALALSIIKQSHSCMIFHLQNLIKLDVKHQELFDIISLVAYMDGGPGLMFAEQMLEAYEQLTEQKSVAADHQNIAELKEKPQSLKSAKGYEV